MPENLSLPENFMEEIDRLLEGLHTPGIGYHYCVNYANTNAKIDFDKSFEAKYSDEVSICACDFSNVDLSGNVLDNLFIANSDFTNTNIQFTPTSVGKLIIYTNLSNNDFSELEFDILKNYGNFKDNNLTNTGLRIIIDMSKFEETNQTHTYIKFSLKEFIEEYWVGCYVNGVLVESPDEKKQSTQAIRQDYEQFKNTEFASVLGSISEQIGDTGRKR